MRLTDAQVAQVVLDVGWKGEDAVTAVALALAASGGDPTLGGPDGESLGQWGVGLWQLSVLRYPGVAKYDLTIPHVAARAAHALFLVTEGLWDWCPAWPGELYQEYVSRARAAVATPSRTAPIGDSPPADVERGAAATATGMIADPRQTGPLIGALPPVDLPPHRL